MSCILRNLTIAPLAVALPLFLNVRPAAAGEETAGDRDFRVLAAPPEVHVCESPELLELIELTDEQRQKLEERLDSWKARYLARQAGIDKLPEDDLRARRGWPPDRDRELNADIVALLYDEQRKQFHWVLALWNYGPVRFSKAHRREYQSELNLTPDQYRQLYELQTHWVQEALPFVTADGQTALGDQRPRISDRVLVVIGTAGWLAKPDRDARWLKILSTGQARRWRQIELQEHLGPQAVRFLVTGRSPQQTSSPYAYFVPYFESPAESLNLSDDQKTRLLAICTSYEQAPNPYDQPELDRAARIAALRTQRRQFLTQVEAVLTEEQQRQWEELLGEPTVFTRWLAE